MEEASPDPNEDLLLEQWLRELKLAPKSKAHVRSIMHLIFRCAERWCLIEMGKNPVALVRVKNSSKRLKRSRVLTVAAFYAVVSARAIPHDGARCPVSRTAVSEIMGLQWGDFDF